MKKLVAGLLLSYDIQNAKRAGAFTEAAGWYFMPAQNGLGVHGIPDFLGHYRGTFFAIETKAPGRAPTGFQALQIKAIVVSRGAVFTIDGAAGLAEFGQWCERNSSP